MLTAHLRNRVGVVGLTGGIGMGKSTVASWLMSQGFPMLDADQTARDLTLPGSPALNAIRRCFGEEVLGEDGGLDRRALADIVFADSSARRDLEAILHPRIREVWRESVARWRRQENGRGVVVIPLLFEVGAAGDFDTTLCVACSDVLRKERLRDRAWSTEHLERRLSAQMPIEEKMRRADLVIWNDDGWDLLQEQIRRVFNLP